MARVLGVLGALGLALGVWLLLRPGAETPPDVGEVGRSDSAAAPEGPVLVGSDPRAAAPPTSDAASATEQPDGVRVRGRILDERRRPVAGARVEAALEGRATTSITTDEGGRYLLALGPRSRSAQFGGLWASEGGRVARTRIYVSPDQHLPLDLGPIVLRATHTLAVEVVHAGRPVPGARVSVVEAEGATTAVRFPEVVADDAGRALVPDVDAERVRVFAGAPGLGRANMESPVPAAGPVRVELPATRSLDVLVVRSPDDSPVPDAEVSVGEVRSPAFPSGPGCLPALPSLRTDARGRVRVTDLPAGALFVTARAPGFALTSDGFRPRGSPVPDTGTEVKVVLEPYRTVSFPILEGPAGVPAEGTPLDVVAYQGDARYYVIPSQGRVTTGSVVIDACPPGHDWGHVRAPDGRWGGWMMKYGSDVGEPLQFQDARDLVVRVRTKAGAPVADLPLFVRLEPRGGTPVVRTDPEGIARFPGLPGTAAHVCWSPSGLHGCTLARFPMTPPPGVTDLAVERLMVTLRVSLDGEARIPPAYTLSFGETGLGEGRIGAHQVEEDLDAATLRFEWVRLATDGPLAVSLEVPGFPKATATLEVRGAEASGAVSVGSSAVVLLAVRPPPEGRYYLRVERFDDARRAWTHFEDAATRAGREAADGMHRFAGLAPGRYRVVEQYSGLATDAFDVSLGVKPVEASLDLSALLVLNGRVVVPEGENVRLATLQRVQDAGEPGGMGPGRVGLKEDGTFEHRALRGSTVRLRVEHPVLKAADATFVAGRDEPILRLERGTEVTFQVEGLDVSTMEADPRIVTYGGGVASGPVVVRPSRDRAALADAKAVPVLVARGRVRFLLPEAGAWHLLVEYPGRVPAVLEGLSIAEGLSDLGTVALPEGATLTVRLRPGKDPVPQYVTASATFLGDPRYVARGNRVAPGSPPFVLVPGLGAGRFRVEVRLPPPPRPGAIPVPPSSGPPVLDEEIDSDGESPLTLEVALP